MTDRCHIMEDPWGDAAIAIRFEEPEESAVAVAAAVHERGLAINGVVAVADKPTHIAALVAERMGMPWHPASATAVCGDKHRMRSLFAAAGLPAPRHFLSSYDPGDGSAVMEFPCVLKPLGLSGSRGVIRANNQSEFQSAQARIRQILNDPAAELQIEQYIPGREFALEGLMTQGELQLLAIFDKPDPLEGPYFEETIYVTPSLESAATQQAIIATTRLAARALGLWHGPVHAEMRVNSSGVYMLEIAARPIGGLCARALRFQPYTLEELVILHAIGAAAPAAGMYTPASGVMMIPVPQAGIFASLAGVDEARAVPGIDDVIITAKPGEKLVPLPEGASYTGFIFGSGPDPHFVTNALRQAHRLLRFEMLASLHVLRN